MTLIAAVGHAQALDGREAGSLAARQAFDHLGRGTAAFGLVVASHDYPFQQVINGVTSILGDVPLLGFSTSASITGEGQQHRSVVVAVLGGGLQARAQWRQGFSEDPDLATRKILQELAIQEDTRLVLVAADGFGGDAGKLVEQYSRHWQDKDNSAPPLAGCLAGGDLRHGRTFQIGGQTAGSRGITGACLSGNIAVGIGAAHGYHPVGMYFHVTQTRGLWIRTLDGQPSSETYARLFGHAARDWAFPPLNELVRLYPLGIRKAQFANKNDHDQEMVLRAPLKVESDGSLRMNTIISEGSTAHILVGSVAGCREAAKKAAELAMGDFARAGGKQPALAILLIDASWLTIMEAQPGEEIGMVQPVIGKDVPIIGGYTLGQIASLSPNGEAQLLNEHIEIILIGDASK